MSRPFQIFLGYCFADYLVDAEGLDDEHGTSNREIGLWFRKAIEDIGGEGVCVVTPEDPIDSKISEKVQRAIDESDAVICVFPKRVRCPYHGWTTSQYVISESGYAQSRFRRDAERRLFAFYEDGVNRETLGLAFPSDRAVHKFSRDNLEAVRPKLEEVISTLLGHSDPPTDDPEPLLLQKTVFVRRDGRAVIDTVYRFRVRKETDRFRMRHTLWRVRESLPDFSKMREAQPREVADYFRCLPLECGGIDMRKVDGDMGEAKIANSGREIGFLFELRSVALRPGDVVEYQFAYSYPHAFLAFEDLDSWERNSAGLRTGGRGSVREAVLIIKFERQWRADQALPSIELDPGAKGPRVYTSMETSFPSTADSLEYWHQSSDWHSAGFMKPHKDLDTPLVEAFITRRENFSGMIKANWQPFVGYHTAAGKAKRPKGHGAV